MSFGPAGNRRLPGSWGPRGPQKPFKNMRAFAPHIFEWVLRPPEATTGQFRRLTLAVLTAHIKVQNLDPPDPGRKRHKTPT